MKIRSYLRSLFMLVSLAFLLSHCSSKNDVTPINTTDLIGKWQTTLLDVEVKYKSGSPLTIKGTAIKDMIEFKQNGEAISDRFFTGLFRPVLYSKYSINKNELTIENVFGELAYFTVSITGSTMTWKMNREQALRAAKNSDAQISLLDSSPATFDNNQDFNMTIEFVKK
jgi:hypothetical protein